MAKPPESLVLTRVANGWVVCVENPGYQVAPPVLVAESEAYLASIISDWAHAHTCGGEWPLETQPDAAGSPHVAVTSAMVRAGTKAWTDSNDAATSFADVLASTFRAMSDAARNP